MSSAVKETATVITSFKLKRMTFGKMLTEIRGYKESVARDEKALLHMQLQAKKQTSDLTLLLADISAQQKKMKHTKELIMKSVAELNKVEYQVKVETNELFIMTNKIKSEKSHLGRMKVGLARRHRAISISEGELGAAELSVKKKHAEIVTLEATLKKHKIDLAAKEAALKKYRGILAEYTLEITRLQKTMMTMQGKISVIKIKIKKMTDVLLSIQLAITSTNKALGLAREQYAAFKRTAAAKLAVLHERRQRVTAQLTIISKQEIQLKQMANLYKQKEAKVASLRITVALKMKQLAQFKALLATQSTHSKKLTLKIINWKKDIAALNLKITNYVSRINGFKIKMAYYENLLQTAHFKWESELLLIQKKFKTVHTEELELKARISTLKGYMAEKNSLKVKYQADLNGMLRKIELLEQQIKMIQEKRLAIMKSALTKTTTVTIKTSSFGFGKLF
jgi:chromosome segregation ATPase